MLFDKRNPGYGTATINFDEVMLVFKVKSLTTVRTWYNKLIKLGLVQVVDSESHILEIVNCDRYIQGRNGNVGMYEEHEYDQPVDLVTQSIGFNSQSIYAKNQSTDAKSPVSLKGDGSKALSSFKVDLGYESKRSIIAIDDYKEKSKNDGHSLLSPEDMRWIEENQHFETRTIRRKDEQLCDQDIADVFFEGDLYQYEFHLQRKRG